MAARHEILQSTDTSKVRSCPQFRNERFLIWISVALTKIKPPDPFLSHWIMVSWLPLVSPTNSSWLIFSINTVVLGCSKHSGSQFTQLSQLRLMEINIKFTLIQSWGTSLISVYLALRWYQPCTLNLVALGRFYIPSNASSCWWWLNVKSLPNSNQRRALSQQFIKWLHSFVHQKKLTTTQWTNIDLLTRLSTFSNAAKCPNYSQQPVQGY